MVALAFLIKETGDERGSLKNAEGGVESKSADSRDSLLDQRAQDGLRGR